MSRFEVIENGGVCSPKGFVAGGSKIGLKVSGNPDLGILFSPSGAITFGAFTRNTVQAAPVLLSQSRLNASAEVSCVVVNSGNANACTGAQGDADALKMVEMTEIALGLEPGSAVVCSTGVIGRKLDMEKVSAGIPLLAAQLKSNGSNEFSDAILTTDLVPKNIAVSIQTQKGIITLGGSAKGSGMIHPDMATMLAFVTTDLRLGVSFDSEFRAIVDDSFNSITVDGDTSTNDTVLLMSNSASGIEWNDLDLSEQSAFRTALFYVFAELAKKIVKDGEGATKFIELNITGADTRAQARIVGRYVAISKLVKTAMFGQDPNWGRIVAAIGGSGQNINPSGIEIWLEDQKIFAQGEPTAADLSVLKEIVSRKEYKIRIELGRGEASTQVWTCDLSYDYIKINAEYTT